MITIYMEKNDNMLSTWWHRHFIRICATTRIKYFMHNEESINSKIGEKCGYLIKCMSFMLLFACILLFEGCCSTRLTSLQWQKTRLFAHINTYVSWRIHTCGRYEENKPCPAGIAECFHSSATAQWFPNKKTHMLEDQRIVGAC